MLLMRTVLVVTECSDVDLNGDLGAVGGKGSREKEEREVEAGKSNSRK